MTITSAAKQRSTFKQRYKIGKARFIVEQPIGTVVYRGPTLRQLRRAHKHGNCQYDCGYCFDEACRYMERKGTPCS